MIAQLDLDIDNLLANAPAPATAEPREPEAPVFSFREFQYEDFCRAAMHPGAIVALDPGGGKTLGMYSIPFMRKARRVLFVVPASLIEQIQDEGEEKLGIRPTLIANQADAYRLMRQGRLPLPGAKQPERSGYDLSFLTEDCAERVHAFITDPCLATWERAHCVILDGQVMGRTVWQTITAFEPDFPNRGDHITEEHLTPDLVTRFVEHAGLQPATPEPGEDAADPEFFITDYKWLGYNQADEVDLTADKDEDVGEEDKPKGLMPWHIPAEHRDGIGHTRGGIRCLGAPSLSTLLADCFDCVCCDEGVRIKGGETTHIGRGVLQLNPTNRYVFTGTPIKNRLTDIFYLLSWVCGYNPDPTPRWPFGRTLGDRHEFAKNHLIMEENESAYERTGRRFVKQTAKICNVHRLWKLLGPVVVRRRKDDMGDLVPKVFKPLHFAPGREQFDVYRWHAQNAPEKKSVLASIGAQLQALRTAAICPWSGRLDSHVGAARSGRSMTPKVAGILQLTADLLEQDEQLVVFSPFQEFATRLGAYYREAGVPHAILDGRCKPKDRGAIAKEFKAKKLPVIICGIESMGEGHSFHMASHLVLPSLTWAWDKNTQAVDRVHRLISERAVSIYIMTTKGTIDERLLDLFHEKGDSNDLALDGRLFEREREDVNLADLLRETLEDFDPATKTIDEAELAENYRAGLRLRLHRLAGPWRKRAAEPSAPGSPAPRRKRPARPAKPAAVKPLDPTTSPTTRTTAPRDRDAIRRMLDAAFA